MLRLERWWDDLVGRPRGAVPGARHDRHCRPAPGGAGRRCVRRTGPELRRLDQRRVLEPDWLQQPDMFGYACYTDRFAGTLARGRRPARLPRATSASPTCT